MLDDFITTNKLKAKVFSLQKELDLRRAAQILGVNNNCCAKVVLFSAANFNFFLFVVPYGFELSSEKVSKLCGEKEVLEASEEECLEYTDFGKGFVPPISIYGAKVFIDKYLAEKGTLLFQVGERDFLKITVKELLASNEDAVIEPFSEKNFQSK